ncbi:uncharacterized protein LTR77_003535 [Saxophila tyrrhenica]|uniref:Uncharacterized protein n=1 Tax=Saxophila tyrrhenica TaxID=1690608 RepID=A0AAV9PGF6_9PEZI|nr:hypothetical protein LTR77_003535 [Saxophila tyrrhenica]
MVAGAWAIADVASMAGDTALSDTWRAYGNDLYERMEEHLYSQELNYWIDVVQGTNLRCEGRELIGMYPYRFDVGTNDTYIRGLEAGLTPEHFLTEFGPTTLEQTNPYYTAFKNSTNCCVWNGQSWPFSTSVYLQTLARLAREGLSDVATSEFFNQELEKYVLTNYKDGVPYTAESHFPTINMWSGDTSNHSEHYLHSTYFDNIFTNLLGVIPTFGDTLVLKPLVPSDWTHFAVENLPYHGTLLSMVWDQDGTHYGDCSAGFSIYSNGTKFHHQMDFQAVNVTLPFNTAEAAQRLAQQPQWQNILANPNSPHGLPAVTADWNLNVDGDNAPYPAWKMNDGLLWYDTTPDNRWTHNQSTVPYSSINITLPRPRKMRSLSLAIFADRERGGVVDCPDGIKVTDSRNRVVVFEKPWRDCVPNALNTVLFADPATVTAANKSTPESGFEIETDFLQVTLSDKLHYTTAVSEIQIWIAPNRGPRYELEDGLVGTFIGGFEGRATGMNGTIEHGGVTLGEGGWVEIADVRRSDSQAGRSGLTVTGGGRGTVEVGVNWLRNHTVSFDGATNKTVQVELLRGGNVVTVFQKRGRPFVDAVTVQ